MYLGPVVAAQQVLDPSSQNSYPQGKKKEGAHPLQQSFQESNPRLMFAHLLCPIICRILISNVCEYSSLAQYHDFMTGIICF